MLNKQKQAFRLYCKRHKHLYRIFSQWFERRTNRALRDNRKQWGIDNDLVVFSSYNMRAYNDNPKYISEALHKMRPQTFIVWLFKDVEAAKAKYAIPDYVRCVEWKTLYHEFLIRGLIRNFELSGNSRRFGLVICFSVCCFLIKNHDNPQSSLSN